MNDLFDLNIIIHHHSEVYCGYFRRLVFGNSLTFSYIPLCFHAKPPNFPRLFDPREYARMMFPAPYKYNLVLKQGNSVARDLPRTGSETNTTIFVIYIYWI